VAQLFVSRPRSHSSERERFERNLLDLEIFASEDRDRNHTAALEIDDVAVAFGLDVDA
jgi:hypothetical protein